MKPLPKPIEEEKIQEEYNIKHNIVPKTILKEIPEVISNEAEEKVIHEEKLRKKKKN